MQIVNILGLGLSLALLVWLSYKGWNALASTLVASLVLCLFNGLNPVNAIMNEYMQGFMQLVKSTLLIFAFGALFGKVMGSARATVSIAYKLLDLIGVKRVILAMLITIVLLTYAGINGFVIIFSVYPIIVALCTEANLPKRLALATMMAGCFTIPVVLPGNAGNIQAMLASALGVSVLDAPLWGILPGALMFILSYLYLVREQKKAQKNGEGFVEGVTAFGKVDLSRDNLPNVWLSLLPMVVLVGFIFIMSNVMEPMASVVTALALATTTAYAIFWKRIPDKMKILNNGLMCCAETVMNVAAITGFTFIIQSLPVFNIILAQMMTWNISPLILLVLILAIVGAVSASAPGAASFFTGGLMTHFTSLGISSGVLMRFAILGSSATVNVPHSGGIVGAFALTGTNHKECYKDIFVTGVVIPVITTVITLLIAVIAGA